LCLNAFKDFSVSEKSDHAYSYKLGCNINCNSRRLNECLFDTVIELCNTENRLKDLEQKYNDLLAYINSKRIVSGVGHDATSVGRISTRSLTFVKKQGATAIKVSYTDNFRVAGSDGRCRYSIRFDGKPCPGGNLFYDLYNHNENTHWPTTILAYCEGLTVGQHEAQVWLESFPELAQFICFTGWLATRWYLEVEEY